MNTKVVGNKNHPSRRRTKNTAVVREVRLAKSVPGAALLLTDGSVWWVADLAVGTWQPVAVSPATILPSNGSAKQESPVEDLDGIIEKTSTLNGSVKLGKAGADAATGIAADGVLSFDERFRGQSISAITVVEIRQDGDVVAESNVERISGGNDIEIAIVAGRDDGWLFLLNQSRYPSPVKVDRYSDKVPRTGEKKEENTPPYHHPWRVSTAWKGHLSRVTAIWCVGDSSTASGSAQSDIECVYQPFTAALGTSRLGPSSRATGVVHGALVSAGADGTIAWWEWNGDAKEKTAGPAGNSVEICNGSGGRNKEITVPKLRMVRKGTLHIGVRGVVGDFSLLSRQIKCRSTVGYCSTIER